MVASVGKAVLVWRSIMCFGDSMGTLSKSLGLLLVLVYLCPKSCVNVYNSEEIVELG